MVSAVASAGDGLRNSSSSAAADDTEGREGEGEEALQCEAVYYEAKQCARAADGAEMAAALFAGLAARVTSSAYKWKACRWVCRLASQRGDFEQAFAAACALIDGCASQLVRVQSQGKKSLGKLLDELPLCQWPRDVEHRLWLRLYEGTRAGGDLHRAATLGLCRSLTTNAPSVRSSQKALRLLGELQRGAPVRAGLPLAERIAVQMAVLDSLEYWEDVLAAHERLALLKSPVLPVALASATSILVAKAHLARGQSREGAQRLMELLAAFPVAAAGDQHERALLYLILAYHTSADASLHSAISACLHQQPLPARAVDLGRHCEQLQCKYPIPPDALVVENAVCREDSFIRSMLLDLLRRNRTLAIQEELAARGADDVPLSDLTRRTGASEGVCLLAHLVRIGAVTGRINQNTQTFERLASPAELLRDVRSFPRPSTQDPPQAAPPEEQTLDRGSGAG